MPKLSMTETTRLLVGANDRILAAAERVRDVWRYVQADARPPACDSDFRQSGELCPTGAKCVACSLERALNDLTVASANISEP